MKIKEFFNLIIEIIISPFSLIFRANAVSNPNKKVNLFFVAIIALFVTAALGFVYYYLYKEVLK